MAITKETQIGKIEVVGKYKSVQVRTDTVVMEDGVELTRKYHRHALMPDVNNNKYVFHSHLLKLSEQFFTAAFLISIIIALHDLVSA